MTTTQSDTDMSVVAPNHTDLNSNSIPQAVNATTANNDTTVTDTLPTTHSSTEHALSHPITEHTTDTEPQYRTNNAQTTGTLTDNNTTDNTQNATTHNEATDNTNTADTDMSNTAELDPIDNSNDLLYKAPLHLAEIQKFTGKPTSEAVFQQRCTKYMKEHNMNIQQFSDVCGIDVQYMKQWLPGKGKTIPYCTFRIITYLLKQEYITEIEYGSKLHDWYMKDRHFLTPNRPNRPVLTNTDIYNNNTVTDISTYNEQYLYKLSNDTYNYPLCQYIHNNQVCNTVAPLTCSYSMCGKHCYLDTAHKCTIHPAGRAVDDYDINNEFENIAPNDNTQTYNEIHGFINTRSGLLTATSHTAPKPLFDYTTHNTAIDYRIQCTACYAYIGIPDCARLVQCTVCLTVQLVQHHTRTKVNDPLPSYIGTNVNSAATLSAQCQQWTTPQVLVFLQNLNLSHLKHYFEQYYIDGKQLLQLDGGMLRENLGIRNETDISALLSAIRILTDSAKSQPAAQQQQQSTLKQEQAVH